MTNVGAWVQDFTYLKFQGAWYYLAVVLDVQTRQIVGWRLGASHSSELTYAAMLDALSKYPPPAILHSDQGSEYLSYKHRDLCERYEIQLPDGLHVRVTLSIGLADASHCPIDRALQQADLALYEAKRLGRNRVVVAAETG